MSKIRKARTVDALELSQLAERTFRATFEESNTPENMNLHCISRYSESIQSDEIADPNMTTLVSEHEGKLIGYAQLRWKNLPKFITASHPVEIQRLYVDEYWHGKGIAKDIMDSCFVHILERGSDVVWLGVWEHNPRAITFYKKFGFTEVGEHIFQLGDDKQRDIVMAKQIVST